MDEQHKQSGSSWLSWIGIVAAMLVLYVLSSGPVLALAFWLRETTGWDGFYSVIWLYWPILVMKHGGPLGPYIEWWVVDIFHTVGPG